jgi:xanthine/CO dehydrogenase XdhC/CoxF family maturation factor
MAIGAQTPAEIAVSILADVVASLPGRESHGWS